MGYGLPYVFLQFSKGFKPALLLLEMRPLANPLQWPGLAAGHNSSNAPATHVNLTP